MHTITVKLNSTQEYRLHHNSDWSGNIVLNYTENGEPRQWVAPGSEVNQVEFPAKVILDAAAKMAEQRAESFCGPWGNPLPTDAAQFAEVVLSEFLINASFLRKKFKPHESIETGFFDALVSKAERAREALSSFTPCHFCAKGTIATLPDTGRVSVCVDCLKEAHTLATEGKEPKSFLDSLTPQQRKLFDEMTHAYNVGRAAGLGMAVCTLCGKTRGHHRRSGDRSWAAHQTALEKLAKNPGTAVPIEETPPGFPKDVCVDCHGKNGEHAPRCPTVRYP